MAIVTAGIDLANNVFAVSAGRYRSAAVRVTGCHARHFGRTDRMAVALSHRHGACKGAHDRVRRFQSFVHSMQPIAPQFVEPYRLPDG